MDLNKLEMDMAALVLSIKKSTNEQEWAYINEEIQANEYAVAFEGVCDLMSEKKLMLDELQKNQIKYLAEILKIEEKFWKHLV